MRYVEIKKDIYLALMFLGLVLLVISVRLASSSFGVDLAGTLLFLIACVQGSICLGFGAFTWMFQEDPEIWS
ncbi:MAG TPA: hypothetical protein EYN91_05555 [Candidatus Melainabacteria bacterium]|jgi:hypothetical protein|nr:hypothetical protein [Candidatus Melainabacteria bacterium]HIN63162.1 hypothetical protein [Candidatus Obscuribacterales bacterium]